MSGFIVSYVSYKDIIDTETNVLKYAFIPNVDDRYYRIKKVPSPIEKPSDDLELIGMENGVSIYIEHTEENSLLWIKNHESGFVQYVDLGDEYSPEQYQKLSVSISEDKKTIILAMVIRENSEDMVLNVKDFSFLPEEGIYVSEEDEILFPNDCQDIKRIHIASNPSGDFDWIMVHCGLSTSLQNVYDVHHRHQVLVYTYNEESTLEEKPHLSFDSTQNSEKTTNIHFLKNEPKWISIFIDDKGYQKLNTSEIKTEENQEGELVSGELEIEEPHEDIEELSYLGNGKLVFTYTSLEGTRHIKFMDLNKIGDAYDIALNQEYTNRCFDTHLTISDKGTHIGFITDDRNLTISDLYPDEHGRWRTVGINFSKILDPDHTYLIVDLKYVSGDGYDK